MCKALLKSLSSEGVPFQYPTNPQIRASSSCLLKFCSEFCSESVFSNFLIFFWVFRKNLVSVKPVVSVFQWVALHLVAIYGSLMCQLRFLYKCHVGWCSHEDHWSDNVYVKYHILLGIVSFFIVVILYSLLSQ